ncbi:terminase [Pseudoalteromonas luteoviolacea]|uniref:Terminase n=1 Tax=Pseudoalteromonas luteoviolacea TaxID=43657 RepID=A0A1C0TVN7_9GAMM|nr:phage terminase small subunit [Pseudoalteromonas luteoviolacea]OCQ23381.1 terminase [Pseudoalteromonas luteoviolacea]TQF70488.1 terminase [Pseudoalteromonas luteoviolacea]
MSLVKQALAKSKGEVPKSAVDAQAPSKVKRSNEKQTEYAFFKAAISSDLAQLKTFTDIADKADYKSTALERNDYLGYINQYRLSGGNHPNIVLSWVFIWLVDLKRWTQAIELLPLLIEQQQPLPTRFNTKHWPTFLVDQLYDEVNWHLQNNKSDGYKDMAFCLYQVIHLLRRQDWAGQEIAGGKLYAIACKLEVARDNTGNAVLFGEQAQEINKDAGVKTLVAKLQKKLQRQ